MILLEANYENAELLFKWANDQQMRKNSFNSNLIKWEDHLQWFSKKLKENNSIIFIAYLNNTPCGQIRFDKINGSAFIDYFIDPNFRGKNLGCEILVYGVEKIISRWENLINIIGEVKKDNIPSIKAFLKAGFVENFIDNKYEFVKKIS